MKTILDEFHEKSTELLRKNVEIIENKLKEVCEKYDLPLDKLIMNYHADGSIEILIKCIHFKIDNVFYVKEE